ncbi:hypothetical protein V7138_08920 [Bacillus sp. JJ1533]|uniref:hypothetical protein n=1 Tax=Bacillus sp. JJ1533 TaxID=3122959 RepID=UPI003000A48F
MGRHNTEKVCIRTRKVYDWVTRQIDVPLISLTDDTLKTKFKCHGNKKDIDELCTFLENQGDVSVNCFLSDSDGNPIDPTMENEDFIIREIMQPNGRHPVHVTLPTGDEVMLQKVKVIVKGFITVEILDAQGMRLCVTKKPIPFATAQTFILCAPEGTMIDAHVNFFECDATLICEPHDLQQLDISITLCLEVQVEADVKLEVEGRFCKPREEILEAALCPTEKFPPQCPEVFPAH